MKRKQFSVILRWLNHRAAQSLMTEFVCEEMFSIHEWSFDRRARRNWKSLQSICTENEIKKKTSCCFFFRGLRQMFTADRFAADVIRITLISSWPRFKIKTFNAGKSVESRAKKNLLIDLSPSTLIVDSFWIVLVHGHFSLSKREILSFSGDKWAFRCSPRIWNYPATNANWTDISRRSLNYMSFAQSRALSLTSNCAGMWFAQIAVISVMCWPASPREYS